MLASATQASIYSHPSRKHEGSELESNTRHSRGGHARAQALSGSSRREIARQGARARWEKERATGPIPKATHRGTLRIGGALIPCAVLSDGRRILSETGITSALGSRSGGSKRMKKRVQESGAQIPVFLAPNNIKPYISDELLSGPLRSIVYKDSRRHLVGYEATILPKVCNVWLDARNDGALQAQQMDRANRAELLIRALADVAIIALVDEATGFQEERDRDELHRLLSMYLSEEKLAWAKRFPDEFYRQLYRLRGWRWPATGAKSPLVGKLTNTLVYERLPKGVLDELKNRNPTEPGTGRRKWKHHQFLSEDIGQPDLRDHLLQLVAVMRISLDWDTCLANVDRAFPRAGTQYRLSLNHSEL